MLCSLAGVLDTRLLTPHTILLCVDCRALGAPGSHPKARSVPLRARAGLPLDSPGQLPADTTGPDEDYSGLNEETVTAPRRMTPASPPYARPHLRTLNGGMKERYVFAVCVPIV